MALLKTHVFGEGEVPLVIVHGLFGSARNWNGISKALAENRRVVSVDLRNHGESFRDPDQSYDAMAGDLADVIETLGGKVDLLGHSMGGKAAVTYSHSQAWLVEALQSLDLSAVSRRSEADKVLRDVITHTGTRLFLLQSLVFEEGVAHWQLNLEVLLAQMPKIMSFPQVSAVYQAPCLFLTGSASDYVQLEHHEEIRRLFPAAQFEALEGAGHWLHAEKPQDFVAAIQGFLD